MFDKAYRMLLYVTEGVWVHRMPLDKPWRGKQHPPQHTLRVDRRGNIVESVVA